MAESLIAARTDLYITSAVAPLLAEPRATATQVSQMLLGHGVRVLERQQPWLRIRGADGYEGWCHRGYVNLADQQTVPGAFPAESESSSIDGELPAWGWDRDNSISLGAKIRFRNGDILDLPLGARVDGFYENVLEITGEIISSVDRFRRFPQTGNAIVESAREYFGSTYYQWGGVTPWGADCSGLVQTVFALHGIRLPRDSHQQAREGHDVSEGLEALREGDLAFFTDREDGRITHVAISAGRARLIHLALGRGGYREETLDSPDEYLTGLVARFRFARRITQD